MRRDHSIGIRLAAQEFGRPARMPMAFGSRLPVVLEHALAAPCALGGETRELRIV
jgi:hypothetical protein